MHAFRPGSSDRMQTIGAPGLWRVIAGFIVWSSAFVTLYVGHALACLYVPAVMSATGVRTILLACWILHLLISAWLVARSVNQHSHVQRKAPSVRSPFLWRTALLVDVSAWGAIFFTGLPLLAFDVCTP